MSVLSSHAVLWHSDRWYRRAWYIWPQTISLLLIGWLFVGELPEPKSSEAPWAKSQSTTKPPPQQQPAGDETRNETNCKQGTSRDALSACNHLIDSGRLVFLFSRAQIYFRNGMY